MGRDELTSEGKLLAGVLVAFVAVSLLVALDLASDRSEGTTVVHVVTEGGAFLVGMFGAAFMARRLIQVVRSERAVRGEALALAERLQASEKEAARWRDEARDLIQGLGAALNRQFERWALSPAEKEVALLLLKGMSHKEVAQVVRSPKPPPDNKLAPCTERQGCPAAMTWPRSFSRICCFPGARNR